MKLNENLCELFGIYLGDGCISETSRYSELAIAGDLNEEKDYYKYYVIPLLNQELVLPLLKKHATGKAYSKVGVYGVYIFNKLLVDQFKSIFDIRYKRKLNASIPKHILENKKYISKLIKGLFDTDGSVFFEKNYTRKNSPHCAPKIKLALTSKTIIDQIHSALLRLGYRPQRIKPYKGKRDKNELHGLKIYRKTDFLRWISEIGFSNPKHLTKIKVWQKYGYCPPYTTLQQRTRMLKSKL